MKKHRETVSTVMDCYAPLTKESTSIWSLLRWAYGPQRVRFAGGNYTPTRDVSLTSVVCDRLSDFYHLGVEVQRSTVCGRPRAHPDADVVHELVCTLGRRDAWLIITSAEAGLSPNWDIDPPRGHFVPDVKANGRPRMVVCPVRRRPIACRVRYEGYTDEQRMRIISTARQRYSYWALLLTRLLIKINKSHYNTQLTRWHAISIGVDECPWEPSKTKQC